MTFLDTLKAAVTLPQVPAHEFRTHPRRDELLHLFLEGGADIVFYRKQMERIYPHRDCVFYDCGGKENVIYARDTVITIPHNAKCFYVVDRDLDPYIDVGNFGNDIFETEFYSVEWYALRTNPVRSFFTNFFQEQPLEEFLAHSEEQFSIATKELAEHLLPYVAYAIAARREGKKVIFSAVRMKDLIHLNHEMDVKCKVDGRTKWISNSSGGAAHRLPLSQLRPVIKLLRENDSALWLRGHFVVEFLATFIRHLVHAVTDQLKPHAGFTELKHFLGQLNERTVFGILSERASVVPAFEDYARAIHDA